MLCVFIRTIVAKSFYPEVQATFQKVFQESPFPGRRECGARARLQPVFPGAGVTLGAEPGGGERAGVGLS